MCSTSGQCARSANGVASSARTHVPGAHNDAPGSADQEPNPDEQDQGAERRRTLRSVDSSSSAWSHGSVSRLWAWLDDSVPVVHLRTTFTTTATVVAVDPASPQGDLAKRALAERIPVLDEDTAVAALDATAQEEIPLSVHNRSRCRSLSPRRGQETAKPRERPNGEGPAPGTMTGTGRM